MPKQLALWLALCLQGDAAVLRAHKKLQVQQGHRQPLDNFNNMQYHGHFQIGPTSVKGIFDTGSFDLLVMSTRCTSCSNQAYDHASSSTYRAEGTMVRHVFGSGSIVSMRGYEKVSVGELSTSNQTIWEIMEHHIPALDVAGVDAIVGMGPGYGPGEMRDATLVMSLNVDHFSFCVQRGAANLPGYLYWQDPRGGADNSDFVSMPVVGRNHWAVRLGSVSFKRSGTSAPAEASGLCESGCGAIVDSGTSLILVPSAQIKVLAKFIQIQRDCSNFHSLPTIHLSMGDHMFALPPRAYVIKTQADGQDTCQSGISNLDKTSRVGPVWVLGLPFLREYYTVFDRSAMQLRVATAGSGCNPTPYVNPSTSAGNYNMTLADPRGLTVNTTHTVDGPLSVDMRFATVPIWAQNNTEASLDI
mmetsp:Transcript_50920/g.111547  ORF Transcript_50920/g.111547 Transcript_50920/m.111547 type:complete len:415 (-) Transcript_50920:83-1327(-)